MAPKSPEQLNPFEEYKPEEYKPEECEERREPCAGCYDKQYFYDKNGNQIGYTYVRKV